MDNPEDLKDIKSLKLTDEIKDFVKSLSQDIEDERSHPIRVNWERRVDKYRRLRYGIRTRKTKPWLDAANYSIPLIDADINRLKPAYVNLFYAVSPVATFEPYGPEDVDNAKNREILFDWRLRTQVKLFTPYCQAVDLLLEQGQVVTKQVWKFRTRAFSKTIDLEDMDEQTLGALYDPRVDDEMLFRILVEQFRIDVTHEENVEVIQKAVAQFREGKSKIELTMMETSADHPEVIVCDLRRDLIVPVDTLNINDARFIDYIYPITINDLKIDIKEGKYEEYDDSTIEQWAGKTPHNRADLIYNDVSDEVIWLHETCCWKDVNGDGIKERCITTWPDADPSSVLRFIENPYDHGEWPYKQLRREFNGPCFYDPRGIPEMDEDFQVAISTFVNQSVDNGTVTNSPRRITSRNNLVNPNNRRFTPMELIEVKDVTQYQEIHTSNNSQPALLQMAQYMKTWADQRLGNATSGLSDPQNLAGMGQGGKRTKAEIDLISGLQGASQSLDLMIFQQQMAEVYYQLDALYEQYGSDEEEFFITGEQPQRLSRQEVQGKFNVVPNGRLDNSNPAVRINKALAVFERFLNDPMVKQRELREMVLSSLDHRVSKNILKTDEELQQEQLQAVAQQEQAKQKAVQEQVGMRKLSDDMDIRKEILLTPVQGRKYAPE